MRPLTLPLLLLCSPTFAASFTDTFDTIDPARWSAADGWTNGSPFAVGWRADHVTASGSQVSLTLDNTPCSTDTALCSGMDYAAGELRTNAFYGYGQVSGVFQAVAQSGVITSLFTYTGPSDANPHDEIDIEILGNDTTKMQANYYVNGVGGHEAVIDLGFDAAAALHEYSFIWSATGIEWLVDGSSVHSVIGGSLPTTPGRIMLNSWAVDASAAGWAGSFSYAGPVSARYDSVSYIAGVPEPEAGAAGLLVALALFGSVRRRRAATSGAEGL